MSKEKLKELQHAIDMLVHNARMGADMSDYIVRTTDLHAVHVLSKELDGE